MSIVSDPRPASVVSSPTTNVGRVATGAATAGDAVETVFAARDLHVRYGSHLAVAGVDLDVAARDITAIIGPSGCGKSTLDRKSTRLNSSHT